MLNIPYDKKLTASLIADYGRSDKILELKGLVLSKVVLVQAMAALCTIRLFD